MLVARAEAVHEVQHIGGVKQLHNEQHQKWIMYDEQNQVSAFRSAN